MKSTFSEPPGPPDPDLLQIAGCAAGNGATEGGYFCTEPWTGLLSVQTDLDVVFCPCFLKMRIGNLAESSMLDVWNAAKLVELRASFSRGILPGPCRGQLCDVALGRNRTPPAASGL